MAELHVGEGRSLKTLNAAAKAAKAGDTIIVHAGTYRETLKLPAGTTWQAAPGEERPVIDGGWNGKSLKGKAGGPAVVHFNAPGATMDSFRIVNGKSTGVGVSADGAVLRNCSVDNSYATGVVVNAGEDVTGVVIEDCDIRRSIMKWPVDGLVGGAALALIGAVGAVVRGCTIMGSWGEGIDVGKGSRGVTVEGCTIGATAHVGLYIVRATDTTLRNNVIFQPTEGTDEEAFRVKPGRVASGIIIGDEASEAAQRYKVHSARSCVEGNVVVNCLALFHARCRLPQSDTSLDDGTRVAGNTFIAGPHTEWGLRVGEEPTNPHGAAIFEKNLIIMDAAPVGVPMAEAADGGDGWKLVWRKNGWTSQPPALFRGAGDVLVPAGTLANAGARIAGTWQGADISIDNYRPVAGGPLDGVGMGALEPLPPAVEAWVMADFEQEPSAGPAPLEVRFTDLSTAGDNATITSWAWEFGDGATSAEPSPVHVYATLGTYPARLTVTDEGRALSHFVVGPEIVVAEVGPEPSEEPEPPVSIWDKLLEMAAALGECLAEMAGERQLAAMAEDHDTAAGLLGELLLRLDEYRQGEEEAA